MRRVQLILSTALALLLLGWLARAPYNAPGGDAGLLRLSWRMRGEAAETCRQRTQQELDALPVHMRAPQVCEQRAVSYRLVVQVDDAPPVESVVSTGARGDRPMYVFSETVLDPGAHRVRVRFGREPGADSTAHAPLTLDTTLDVQQGSIELITLDADTGRLVHRGRAP